MKVITYKNLNMGETIINFLFLLFQQAIFFGLIFIYVSLDYIVYMINRYIEDNYTIDDSEEEGIRVTNASNIL